MPSFVVDYMEVIIVAILKDLHIAIGTAYSPTPTRLHMVFKLYIAPVRV